MTTYTATYSPEDNKLRLSASSRLDPDLYERAKALGFRWAPKQEVFIAPMWTPGREDFLIELCGEIGDEDTSLVQRAEERADRFEDYSDKRAKDADSAYAGVASVGKRFEFGQPILIGHHSEKKARKDKERMESGMRQAVKMWETSTYWKSRAAAALQHASYKERPDVRARRIKGLESDKRKQERLDAKAVALLKAWQDPALTLEQAKRLADMSYSSRCYPLADFPRDPPASQYEGQMGLWSALDGGVITMEQARTQVLKSYANTIKWAARWIAHYTNRIDYERAMLGEAGGLKGEAFDIQPGGRVLVRNAWVVVVRVNRKDGKVCSVTTADRYVSVRQIEEIKDYQAPTEAEAAAVKVVTKIAPLVNVPGEGFIEMTSAQWMAKHKDYRVTRTCKATEEHGAYRFRSAFLVHENFRRAQVYLTDAKRVELPPVAAAPAVAVSLAPIPVPRPAVVAAAAAEPDTQAAEFAALKQQLKTGVKVVVADQLFPTPDELAGRMVDLAEIEPGHTVLEPSAGTGNILKAIRECTHGESPTVAVEINRDLCSLISGFNGQVVINRDFLSCGDELGTFDRILMNPPFGKAQDIAHILHAITMLKPGGRLVAICAGGGRQLEKLRPLVDQSGGTWEVLPAGTFKESGTGVNTVLMVFLAAQAAQEEPKAAQAAQGVDLAHWEAGEEVQTLLFA